MHRNSIIRKMKHIESLESQVVRIRHSVDVPSEKYTFCLHTTLDDPFFSVWPKHRFDCGNKCDIGLEDGVFYIKSYIGFSKAELDEIVQDLNAYLES